MPSAAVTFPQGTGVFGQESTLPFKTVDFAAIQDSDYAPAYEQAMAIERAEIAAITANPQAPTFANTIVAIERAGRMLRRVQAAFSTEVGANTNPVLDAVDAGDAETARALVEPLHPADVADLIELARADEREGLVSALAELVDADVLAELNEHVREILVSEMTPERVAEIAGELDTDDAVAIIEDLEEDDQ